MDLGYLASLRGLSGPILVTGHTGFKGSWMIMMLRHHGIETIGYALPPREDSLYRRAALEGYVPEQFGDVCNYVLLENFIDLHKPSAIIHMAAQPLVLESYLEPKRTFETNLMGTVNVLDIASKKRFLKSIVVVTTDKVYKNSERQVKFKESDPLGGKDPYSASKVATESAVDAWRQISEVNGGPNLASARAGNVIGGGDFTPGRLFPDIVRTAFFGERLHLRNLNAVRPWQHVLDPLQGYLMLLDKLVKGEKIRAVNFSCLDEQGLTVTEVLDIVREKHLVDYTTFEKEISHGFESKSLEANWLDLDSNYAKSSIGWENRMNQRNAIQDTFDWWERVLVQAVPASVSCEIDIKNFFETK
jgi:CDP-glucose 4,6-dehydratase